MKIRLAIALLIFTCVPPTTPPACGLVASRNADSPLGYSASPLISLGR
jgi:hypothetical protein